MKFNLNSILISMPQIVRFSSHLSFSFFHFLLKVKVSVWISNIVHIKANKRTQFSLSLSCQSSIWSDRISNVNKKYICFATLFMFETDSKSFSLCVPVRVRKIMKIAIRYKYIIQISMEIRISVIFVGWTKSRVDFHSIKLIIDANGNCTFYIDVTLQRNVLKKKKYNWQWVGMTKWVNHKLSNHKAHNTSSIQFGILLSPLHTSRFHFGFVYYYQLTEGEQFIYIQHTRIRSICRKMKKKRKRKTHF